MSYIGKGIKSVSSANITVDTMVGDGVVNTLALSQSGVESVKDVSVYYQGVAQVPNVDYTLTASTVTFTTIPAVGMKVVAVTKGDSIRDKVNDSSASGTSFADNAITDSKIIGLDASKLTGALPAMDGSALTNASIPTAPLRSSASDPAVDTNGAAGDIFANTTTGQLFVLTDDTTDQNIWTNAGNGDGNIMFVPYTFPGTTYGYSAGGSPTWSGSSTVIDEYAFASSNTHQATNTGDVTLNAHKEGAGACSKTYGYCAAGSDGAMTDTYEKRSFAAGGNMVLVGNLSYARHGVTGHSDGDNGYAVSGASQNLIEQWSYLSDATNSDIGDLTYTRGHADGQSSSTDGYVCNGAAAVHSIDKFSFSSGVSSVIGIVQGNSHYNYGGIGMSSAIHGYSCSGGYGGKQIRKFSFASNGDAVHTANLADVPPNYNHQLWPTGAACETSYGYVFGGNNGVSQIQSISFTSNSHAVYAGNLSSNRCKSIGLQV
jgi:hypothetical protein